jgi:hypothetical protein
MRGDYIIHEECEQQQAENDPQLLIYFCHSHGKPRFRVCVPVAIGALYAIGGLFSHFNMMLILKLFDC